MRIASLVWVALTLVVCSLPLRAQSPYAGLIVYALDDKAPFLLLERRGTGENVWAAFTASPGRAKVEDIRDEAIQHAVMATRCFFTSSGLGPTVEPTYFRQPWESPAYVVYFARLPKIERGVLEHDERDCPEGSGAPYERSLLAWVPWTSLRADLEAAAGGRGTLPVRLVASARYLPGTSGEARLLAGFAEALRRMIAESGRKDSTIEFTLPW